MSLLRRTLEARDFSLSGEDPWSIPSNGSLGISNATGVPVTEEKALGLATLFRCVAIIADGVSTPDLQAVQADKNGVLVPKNPQPQVILSPFYGMTRQDGVHRMMVSLLMRGNSFNYVVSRDYLGRPTKLLPIPPDSVTVKQRKDGTLQYKVGNTKVDDEDMIHVRGFTVAGNPLGLSVIDYARQTLGLALAAEEFGARFFANGAVPSAVIEVPNQNFTNEKARELKERIEAKHAGLKRAHNVAVLAAGATWKSISVTPNEAQFMATRQFQSAEIAKLFGVPPHLLGDQNRDTSWGTGIEQQMLQFMHFTLHAWFTRVETMFSALLPAPQSAKFDLSDMLRTDAAGRFSVYMQARTMGVFTINEIRAKENMPPLPGGDDLFAPLNSSTKSPLGGDPADSDEGLPSLPGGNDK